MDGTCGHVLQPSLEIGGPALEEGTTVWKAAEIKGTSEKAEW